MNILIAPDSFKGSLTAVDAAEAMAQGVRAVLPEAEVVRIPLADGGEGTVDALVSATGGRVVPRRVTGPLGEPVEAFFGLLGDDVTAVIESAAAAGLGLIPPERRDPRLTTTYGVGELIAAALDEGRTRIIIGLGGSGTNDGGAGMAEALGARLVDVDGNPLPRGGAALAGLGGVDATGLDPRLAQVEVLIASDVTNPLLGPEGATAVYGPQKGATPEMVVELEEALTRWAEVLKRDLDKDVGAAVGAGAAGGLGAALMAFLGGQPRLGVQLVLETAGFEEYLESADLVLSGEGSIDTQTLYGKTLVGVARLAQRHGVPVIAIAGSIRGELDELLGMGLASAFSLTPGPLSEAEAMRDAGQLLQDTTERVIRALLVGREMGARLGSGS